MFDLDLGPERTGFGSKLRALCKIYTALRYSTWTTGNRLRSRYKCSEAMRETRPAVDRSRQKGDTIYWHENAFNIRNILQVGRRGYSKIRFRCIRYCAKFMNVRVLSAPS